MASRMLLQPSRRLPQIAARSGTAPCLCCLPNQPRPCAPNVGLTPADSLWRELRSGDLGLAWRGRTPLRTAATLQSPPHPSESFLRSSNGTYAEEMFEQWQKTANVPSDKVIRDHLNVLHLIRAYQVRGHNKADLDPLKLGNASFVSADVPELHYKTYGFTEADLDRKFVLGTDQITGVLGNEQMTLRDIIARLEQTYCGTIGYEYMHIKNRQECNWIRDKIERRPTTLPREEQVRILDRLMWAELFESFIAKKWTSEKRFGLEGAEALIPGVKALIDVAADLGTRSIVIGMPHRGRLNVLANVVRKPQEAIFSEFSGNYDEGDSFSGDVKYHLGMTFDRPTTSGKTIHLSVVANPSHLEAVDPVVLGKVRGLQYLTNDVDRSHTMALIMHGDAAFAGQGVVYESMGLTSLPNYSTGGSMHVVVNNQIGFTTDARVGRSTPYCTDIALAYEAPVFHVNADDIEASVHAFTLAAEYRAKFKKDVVVDLIGYRRHGHNEVDNPRFTQPVMYAKISKHPTALTQYEKQLVARGTVTEQEVKSMRDEILNKLEQAYSRTSTYKSNSDEWTTSKWMAQNERDRAELKSPKAVYTEVLPAQITGVDESTLKQIGKALVTLPQGIVVDVPIEKALRAKDAAIQKGQNVDWPTAEALAFGTLLLENRHVRLSGQDVERGTFSQRHAVLHDQNGKVAPYVPLNHIAPSGQQAEFHVTNSHLSEYGVMGFELGYSYVSPTNLVLWEAQFGDFANTAQVIIDQFIASGEKKWKQPTGLVLLLPHGYDGAGPEHSSARMERFLQLCDDDPEVLPDRARPGFRRQIQDGNMQVVYPSTAANYFHVLRRQVHRQFRKPLIIMESKNLFKNEEAASPLADMAAGTKFRNVIPNDDAQTPVPADVDRIVFCSGQVYYQLAKARKLGNLHNVAICRVEQISPFPYDHVVSELERFPNAHVVWAQEEPLNAGAWSYVGPRLQSLLRKWTTRKDALLDVTYAGRPPAASTATGFKKQHLDEEKKLIKQALYGTGRH